MILSWLNMKFLKKPDIILMVLPEVKQSLNMLKESEDSTIPNTQFIFLTLNTPTFIF